MCVLLRRLSQNARRVISVIASRFLARKLKSLGRENAAEIPTVDASDDHPGAPETLLATNEAIRMLQECSVVHLRWMRRCVNQIVLTAPMQAPAAFERFTRRVLLSCDVGAQHDSAAIATFLAHEVSHARLSACGVRVTGAQVELQRRVERRCVREQLEAIQRIDSNHYLVPWSCELLLAEAEPQLTPSVTQVRARTQRAYRRIRAGGYPRWIGRLAVCIGVGGHR